MIELKEGDRMIKRNGSKAFLRFVEMHASSIRERAGVGALDRLNPREVADRFGIIVARPGDLPGLAADDIALLDAVDAKEWSGVGLPLPNNRLVVVLHSRQTEERAAVTLLEEVAHAHFNHRPSRLVPNASGLVKRDYDPQAEREAYWTAAATLLPALAVARAMWEGRSFGELAAEYGASVELVSMRVKILGLWQAWREAA